MSSLTKFDFNHKTGYLSVILGSIGISFLVFAAVYVIEGMGWLAAYEDEKLDLYLDIGWNWIRGGGAAFAVAVILIASSAVMLAKNKRRAGRATPLFGKLDLNNRKGLMGLTLIATSFAFFFNGIFYRQEATRWFFGAIETVDSWKLEEAAAWISASTTMIMIGILLSAAGFTLLALSTRAKVIK